MFNIFKKKPWPLKSYEAVKAHAFAIMQEVYNYYNLCSFVGTNEDGMPKQYTGDVIQKELENIIASLAKAMKVPEFKK
jgi:hypothetical protein